MQTWLLEIIRCPITGQPLKLASAELVTRLLGQQQAGKLFSHKGIAIEGDFDSGLINHSETFFYRISDNIPSLLPDEAVKLESPPARGE